MSVEKMKLVTLTGRYESLSAVAEACLASGVFQPENTAERFSALKNITRNMQDATAQQPMQKLLDLVDLLGDDFMAGLPESTELDPAHKKRMRHIVEKFNHLQQEASSDQEPMSDEAAADMKRFGGLRVREGDVFTSDFIKIVFGQLSSDSYLFLKTVGKATSIVFLPLSKEEENYYGMFLLPRSEGKEPDLSFLNINEENPYQRSMDLIVNLIQRAGEDLGTLPDEANLPPLLPSEVDQAIEKIEQTLGGLQKQREELHHQIETDYENIAQLSHFTGLDIRLGEIFDSKHIKVRFGRLPLSSYNQLSANKDNPYMFFVPFSRDKRYCWGMYVAPLEHGHEIDRIFAGLSFERLRIPNVTGTAAEEVQNIRQRIENAKQRISEIDQEEHDFWTSEKEHCKTLYAQLQKQSSIFEMRKYAVRHADNFILVGWVSDQPEALLQTQKALPDVELTVEDVSKVKEITPPVQLKNPKLFRPFEFYIKTFGLPNYFEVDPTIFVAITYTLLYGIMFADFGQGILLCIAGWLMYRLKKMDIGRILIPCGISGAFFGFLFGSCFGFEHAFDWFYQSVFGLAEKPIEIMDPNNTTTILMTAIGIGVVLMFCAIIINIYSCLKQHKTGEALFSTNGVAGLLLYAGILLLLLSMLVDLPIPMPVILIVFLALPVVCLWLQEPLAKLVNRDPNWKPESWGGYLVQGFFEIFESLLSYVTNTVSFLRVGAFVLMHATMMMVFFSIGETIGGAGNIIMIIFGNIFVTCLEGLLVGVQALRLEFYEMFSRFFDGSGRSFEPIRFGSNK